jgi:hypothetical protein
MFLKKGGGEMGVLLTFVFLPIIAIIVLDRIFSRMDK